jgi:glycosyltransferase involved in cell wall biosynthesis
MKVLKVIHGFPPDYMAGSEVYSYHLVKELIAQNIDTLVFTRVENEFEKPYKIYDEIFEDIPVFRVNKPQRDYLYEDKFYDPEMETIFKNYLDKTKPDIVHFGHLSHLSTKLISIVKELNIPVVYTIHDFWLFCVKGQMVNEIGEICTGPSAFNCNNCSPYVTNENMVQQSLEHMRQVVDAVDIFISPSHTLRNFFIEQNVPPEKIKYLKYGFNSNKITFQPKVFHKNSKITFGFMGRVIPTKGIDVVVNAFKGLSEELLHIYGAIGIKKRFLETENIIFKGSYDNNNINNVLNEIDVLIVPSIWYENAPLVIQEAFLAGIPVITSDIGGMAELVENNVTGYTFKTGNSSALKEVISDIVSNPTCLNTLQRSRDSVVDIKDDVKNIVNIYQELIH